MKRVAIIPARGGSKRIPHKNVMDFEGRPLIAWTIAAARESGLFQRVIVSTDDDEIARIARQHGAEVPFLRERYADDDSPVSLATVETLERLIATEGVRFDSVVQLFAVCPLRTAEDIHDAVTAFDARSAAFQVSCFELGWMRPWWAVKLTSEGRPMPLFPDAYSRRSQDLEPLYCPTGATWIARPDALLRERTFYGEGHLYHAMPWQRAIDIDGPDDVLMAQVLFRTGAGRVG
jgi:N-acylneuraminate cytidylyltransferase